ncbi:hypothetical protein LBMAG46_41300 [Planctomycetia bacterium]|nr:hypothetical protein LBMAG46_41300 [Planctomycetia bacterium]
MLIGLSVTCVTPGDLGPRNSVSFFTGFEAGQPFSLAIALGVGAISGVGDEGSELTTSDLVRQQDKRADAASISMFQYALLPGLTQVWSFPENLRIVFYDTRCAIHEVTIAVKDNVGGIQLDESHAE